MGERKKDCSIVTKPESSKYPLRSLLGLLNRLTTMIHKEKNVEGWKDIIDTMKEVGLGDEVEP